MSFLYENICVFSYNVSIINGSLAIAYPHPIISSKYLWPHSFRFMFQFKRINVTYSFLHIVNQNNLLICL